MKLLKPGFQRVEDSLAGARGQSPLNNHFFLGALPPSPLKGVTPLRIPIIVLLFSLLLALPLQAAPQVIPDPVAETAFIQTQGFTGGDGVYSIALDGNRVLWLFGDSLIGTIKNKRRQACDFIHNSVAISEGSLGPEALKYRWRRKGGKASDFFQPQRPNSWFWPLHGLVSRKTLYVFLHEIEATPDGGVFGFRSAGNVLAIIRNYQQDPYLWQIKYKRIPWFDKYRPGILTLGNGVLPDGRGGAWLYGLSQPDPANGLDKRMFAVHVLARNLPHPRRWKVRPPRQSLVEGATVEFTPSRRPDGRILLVWSKGEITREVWAAWAPGPGKSFGKTIPVYHTPDPGKDCFVYAAKAHPALENEQGLLLTWIVNGSTWEALGDAAIYHARCLRWIPENTVF